MKPSTAGCSAWPDRMPDLLGTPCPYLTRDDGSHTYRGPDGLRIAKSVTGVLAASDPPGKKAAIMATKHLWEGRGNACHGALEQFIQSGLTWTPTYGDPAFTDWAAWIVPLLNWPVWREVTFTASELAVHHPEDDVAGCLDGAFRNTGGQHVLFDLKSRGRASDGTYSTAAQLGGYLHLCERWGIVFDTAATIWARPGRWPTVSLYSLDDCRNAWAKAWAAYQQSLPF